MLVGEKMDSAAFGREASCSRTLGRLDWVLTLRGRNSVSRAEAQANKVCV